MTSPFFLPKRGLVCSYRDMWKLWSRGWSDYIVTILIAVCLALMVRTVFLAAYRVPTGSMRPALLPGDFIFSNRLAYGLSVPILGMKFSVRSPERGDLVVFRYPDRPDTVFVKRVIGVEGDRIDIKGYQVFLNKVPFEYIPAVNLDNPDDHNFQMMVEKGFGIENRIITQKKGETSQFGPYVVPPGHVFIMGDNRDTSDDSRFWGPVPIDHIEGKAAIIWLSLEGSQAGGNPQFAKIRWDRIFKSIH